MEARASARCFRARAAGAEAAYAACAAERAALIGALASCDLERRAAESHLGWLEMCAEGDGAEIGVLKAEAAARQTIGQMRADRMTQGGGQMGRRAGEGGGGGRGAETAGPMAVAADDDSTGDDTTGDDTTGDDAASASDYEGLPALSLALARSRAALLACAFRVWSANAKLACRARAVEAIWAPREARAHAHAEALAASLQEAELEATERERVARALRHRHARLEGGLNAAAAALRKSEMRMQTTLQAQAEAWAGALALVGGARVRPGEFGETVIDGGRSDSAKEDDTELEVEFYV